MILTHENTDQQCCPINWPDTEGVVLSGTGSRHLGLFLYHVIYVVLPRTPGQRQTQENQAAHRVWGGCPLDRESVSICPRGCIRDTQWVRQGPVQKQKPEHSLSQGVQLTVVKPGVRTAEKGAVEGDTPARCRAADAAPERRRLGSWNLKLGEGAGQGRRGGFCP